MDITLLHFLYFLYTRNGYNQRKLLQDSKRLINVPKLQQWNQNRASISAVVGSPHCAKKAKPNYNEKCANKWKHFNLDWYNSVKSTVVLARLDTQTAFSERKMSRIWGGLKLNAPVSVVQHTNWIQQVNSFKPAEETLAVYWLIKIRLFRLIEQYM